MLIKKISIEGLRGFSEKTCFEFALPDGKNIGSGLTILVGPNNSGKSTVIEAVHILNSNSNSIPKMMRNSLNGGNINIELENEMGKRYLVTTTDNGGSFIERYFDGVKISEYDNKINSFILSNKRNFTSTFGNNSEQSRESYKSNVGSDNYRNESQLNQNFGARLLKIYNGDRPVFDNCLRKVISPVPKWTIESLNESQLYLEFSFGKTYHSSQGSGDGFINIFNIIDSLYDSNEKETILIDEPEISLHPDLQRKLFNVLLEYSKNRQIIISTHSPYFIDWNVLVNYSKIIRLRKENDKILRYEISDDTKKKLKGLLKNINNPHILSLDTNEVFFLGDNIILVEGQEDVLGYKKIFELNNFVPNASFFGWGMGSADNVDIILKLLCELGYKKIFTIFDNDRKEKTESLEKEYPQYCFYAIPTNDIRNKNLDNRAEKIIEEISKKDYDENIKNEIIESVKKFFPEKEGILISLNDGNVNKKYDYAINELIASIKSYFDDEASLIISSKEEKDIVPNEEQLAQDILCDYLETNSLYKKVYDKYDYISFNGGGGGLLSLKQISNNEFYAIVEESNGINEKYIVTKQYHFIININTKKVKLKKEITLSDSIPKKY